MIDAEGRVWPDDPAEHIMSPPKKRKPITKEYKYRKKSIFYKINAFFLRMLALTFLPIGNFFRYRYKIKGKKNLKELKKQGYVVVANHVLHMDAAIIASSIFRWRKLHFVILGENATIPVAGKIITALGGVPIADDIAGTKEFLRHCNWLLENNKPLMIFPEKALWHGYKGVRPFDKGAFKIAVSNNVPVLPIVITLKNRNKNKKKPLYKVYFEIKKPIYPNDELKGNVKIEELRDRTHRIFEETTSAFYDGLKKKKS